MALDARHDEWLTLWTGLNFWLAFMVGQTGFLTVRARMAGATRASVAKARWSRRVAGAIAFIILASLSWLRTEGGFENYADWVKRNGDWTASSQPATWLNANLPTTEDIADRTDLRWFGLYPANLREAVLIAKPDDWQPYDRWLKDFREAYRKENGIDPKIGLPPAQLRAFWAEARDEWSARLASLTGPELRQRDLRHADMTRAILPRADLRGARLDGANLREAELQGAELVCWKPSSGESHCTSLQGTSLRLAEMQGANLFGAEMQNANCNSAALRGALLQFANVTCRGLTQEQLEGAVGNSDTVLPDGLTVASCLKTLPEDVEAALAHHPEAGDFFRTSRAQVRDALLCDDGEKPFRIDYDPFERRFWKDFRGIN